MPSFSKCLREDVMGWMKEKDQHQVSIEMWMENVRRINIACVLGWSFIRCRDPPLRMRSSMEKTKNRYKIYLLEFHRSENPARVKVNFRYLFLLSNLHRWSDTKILYFNFVEMIVSWFESKWLCGLLCSVKEKCCGLSYRSRKSSFPNSSSCNLIQFISASNDVILSAFALPFASTNLRISNI